MIEIEDVVRIVQGKLIRHSKDHSRISHLLSDSRHLAFPSQALFFAIRGPHHNGHDFIPELYEKGLRSFIIETPLSQDLCPEDANLIQVDSSIAALQSIAGAHRQQFDYPVLAITGSNGKTIIKEWLDEFLSGPYHVVKSPRSYNSQIGVPLSLWQMESHHNFAIFEAGISLPGEMERLEDIIRPDIGIFTNIGSAHDEGFGSIQDKIREKLKLFERAKRLIYCRDHQLIHQLVQSQLPGHIQTITWGKEKSADLWVLDQSIQEGGQSLELSYRGRNIQLPIPFRDEASFENLMHCLCLMLSLGISERVFEKKLPHLSPISMRLELKEGRNNNFLIDDSYNHDLAGLKIALDVLAHQNQRGPKVVILSDPAQTGLEEPRLFQKIKDLVEEMAVDLLIGIGPGFYRQRTLFSKQFQCFEDTGSFLNSHLIEQLKFSLILVKGARRFAFEKIVRRLSEKRHQTVLEINLDALAHNLNFYRGQLKSQTKLMVMVKAFAYGNGSMEIAQLLQFHRVDYLAVAYVDEGVFLRKNGIHLPIMVLNPSESDFDNIIEYQLEPEIYRFSFFQALEDYLKSLEASVLERSPLKVHIKLDTGMHRLGFQKTDLERLLKYLGSLKNQVRVASVFSHLAAADNSRHQAFTLNQIKDFEEMSHSISQVLNHTFLRHIVNSAGIVMYPQAHLDMVRLGVGLYGIEASQQHQDRLRLVSRLKTYISQIKWLKKGDTVGYGRKGIAEKDTRVATIAIGYADGFSRRLSNAQGSVLVNGTLVPVIGSVCMDMTMIDITEVEAQEGDEVIIFGEGLPIQLLAQKLNTIPYEILTSIGERVKRIYYRE